jgi:hypothetical protein
MVWQSVCRRPGNNYQKIQYAGYLTEYGGDNINVEEIRGHHGAAVVAAPYCSSEII